MCESEGTIHHTFDQHGTGDNLHTGGDAGDWHVIYHNTFEYTNQPGFRIRGTPVTGSWLDYNWFYRDTPYVYCITQVEGDERVYAGKNAYGASKDITEGAIDYD